LLFQQFELSGHYFKVAHHCRPCCQSKKQHLAHSSPLFLPHAPFCIPVHRVSLGSLNAPYLEDAFYLKDTVIQKINKTPNSSDLQIFEYYAFLFRRDFLEVEDWGINADPQTSCYSFVFLVDLQHLSVRHHT